MTEKNINKKKNHRTTDSLTRDENMKSGQQKK